MFRVAYYTECFKITPGRLSRVFHIRKLAEVLLQTCVQERFLYELQPGTTAELWCQLTHRMADTVTKPSKSIKPFCLETSQNLVIEDCC